MATKNKKQTTLNSPPPTTSSSSSSSSPPLADSSTPRTKSAPPHPVKKTKHNGFRRNVNDVIRSVPRATAKEEEEEVKLPKYDQLQTQLDAHAPTIPSPVQDVHADVELPKQDQRSTSMSQTVPESLFLEVIDKLIWGEDDEFDQQSLEQKAEEELYKRPKKGETYEAVNVELIEKRLKHLSKNVGRLKQTPYTMIDEGLEIADSVSLLKIKGTSSSKVVEMAGQKAQKAATLMIQSKIMFYKAKELLAQSKDILQAAEF